ncbi:MAG TPA: methyltransferase domain-containing protein [Flavisolibacter sp.]|nr:methyltransferase domain-containing protein [Flavisolibacter sp.]
MRSHSWLRTAAVIIRDYDGTIPLAVWLKQYFKIHTKAGATDRKHIAHLCYCFFRLGHAFIDAPMEERLLKANFLCSTATNKVLEEIRPEWNQQVQCSLDEKLSLLSGRNELKKIFPFASHLSNSIDEELFHRSFLVQPDLYLRIRPGKKAAVLSRLEGNGIEFTMKTEDCVALSNQTKTEELFKIDEVVVVQDLNSQLVLEPLRQMLDAKRSFAAWDCCAASGGKSILLHDRFPNARLTVSDVRPGILQNLQNRFKRAGIRNYGHFVSDIASTGFQMDEKFDLVICDAPCSGSGTWSRTPEQLSVFREEKISYYANLQKRIAANAAGQLKDKGIFVYITCSVFHEENEVVVTMLEDQLSLKPEAIQYLKGYDKKADTLFAAVFTRS